MKASIDQLVDEARAPGQALPHARRATGRRRAARANGPQPDAPSTADERRASRSSRRSSSRSNPMTPEEAVLQLELVGHDFFVFRNADSETVNVVYRRRDGGYGLIEPAVIFRREPLHEKLAREARLEQEPEPGARRPRPALGRDRDPRRPAPAPLGRRRHGRGARPDRRRGALRRASERRPRRRRGRAAGHARAARRRDRADPRAAVPRRGRPPAGRRLGGGRPPHRGGELPRPTATSSSWSSSEAGRTLTVDGAREFGSIPELERIGGAQGEHYVVRAQPPRRRRSGRSRPTRCTGALP